MALKAGYYGLKRSLLNKVKELPGIKSIGTGLSLNSTTGELEATGATISIEANPEAAATENLVKLGLGENVYAVPDAAKTYQTDDETVSAIVDADYIPFFDSSAASGSGAPKKSTWSNFISKIKAKITEFVTWEANNILGAKNLLPNFAVSTGIFTVNSDGTVLANGETSTSTLKLTDRQALNFALPAGSYILSGCPSGGDITTYFMNCGRNATKGDPTSSWVAIGNDTGDGLAFTLESAADVQVSIEIRANANDLLFKPMIRLASDPDNTYVPYAMTNRELTEKVHHLVHRVVYASTDEGASDITVSANGYTDISIPSITGYRILTKNVTISGTGSSAFAYVSAAGGIIVARIVNRDSSSHTWSYEVEVYYIATDEID